jgi:protocatechuate 3,4-dioxygenase beta subunit
MNDDKVIEPSGEETYLIGQRGRSHLSRREMLSLIGTAGAASVFGTLAANQAYGATCIEALPEEMEGPLFVEEVLNRSDVRIDPSDGSVSKGVPVKFSLQVYDLSGGGCPPLKGVHVDIWSCDTEGNYSDEARLKTQGKKFLRGYQVTDSKGMVQFTSIYPGWYTGRTAHIHVSLRTFSGPRTFVPPLPKGCCTHTPTEQQKYVSQLYFPEPITEDVYKLPPYNRHTGRDTTNATDGIFNRTPNAGRGMLNLNKAGDGYSGKVVIGVSLKAAKDYHFNGRAGAPERSAEVAPK